MGSLFSTLNIARSGLSASQTQLDTAGHNIANVNKAGYSRQRVELVSNFPVSRGFGQIGTGVAVADIRRIRDEFLDDLYQTQVAGLGGAELRAEYYELIEGVFLEPTDSGLSERLNDFFNALNEYSTNVESIPVRTSVITEANALANAMNDTSERFRTLRTNANQEVLNFVPEINSLTDRIASINTQITNAELDGTTANDLRDDREVLLDELAKIVNIFTRERADGQVDVLVSGEIIVDGGLAIELEAVSNAALDSERNDLVEVRFAKSGQLLNVADGELFAALEMRDVTLVDIDNDLDQMAAVFIEQLNKIHGQASGLSYTTSSAVAGNPVTDPAITLSTAGLPFPVSPGTFDIHVYDESTSPPTPLGGMPVTITILATSTLDDIAAQLNAVSNITASVNSSGYLSITPDAGFSFTNANDDTNVLAALGLNGLFNGVDARTISLSSVIEANPELLASRYSTNPLETGDNTAALAMLDMQNGNYFSNSTADIYDFYEATVVQVGVDTRANQQTLEVERTFVASFEDRRQETSVVSLDEEVTLLIQYQRAFEASARVISVTDRMLDALMAMAR